MTIGPISPRDTDDILRIARENGLPASWSWPGGCHGGVAKEGDRVVAFAAIKELPWDTPFLAYEEFWCEQTPTGHTGLLLLGQELERIAQRLADERGVTMKTGGFVHSDRKRHAQALKRRGYTVEGEVLTKTFAPAVQQEVA